MAYITTINQQTHRVDTGENGPQNQVTLDNVTYPIDWRQLAPLAADAKGNIPSGGRYSLLIAGKTYDIFACRITRPDQKESETYEILLAGQRFEVQVEDERVRLLASLTATGPHSSTATVHAPMPGLVISLPVEPGATVTTGQTVVVLEAMKMENDLSSPISGTIQEIRVTQGQTVDQGEALIIISASS
jgi:biotin carboxyl carrier protein